MTCPSRNDSASGRTYTVEVEGRSVRLPSVTTVLGIIHKGGLERWLLNKERELITDIAAAIYHDLKTRNVVLSRDKFAELLRKETPSTYAGNRIAAEAARIGTQAHGKAEWHFRAMLGEIGLEPKVHPQAQYAYERLIAWVVRTGFEPIKVEMPIYHTKYGYAGTMDLYGRIGTTIVLLDLKTSNSIHRSAILQNIAYMRAVEHMGMERPEYGLIIRMPKYDKEEECEVTEVPNSDALFEEFRAALTLWKGEHGRNTE